MSIDRLQSRLEPVSLNDILLKNLTDQILPPNLTLVPQLNEVYELELAFYESKTNNNQLSKIFNVHPKEVTVIDEILVQAGKKYGMSLVRKTERQITGMANTMRSEFIVMLQKDWRSGKGSLFSRDNVHLSLLESLAPRHTFFIFCSSGVQKKFCLIERRGFGGAHSGRIFSVMDDIIEDILTIERM